MRSSIVSDWPGVEVTMETSGTDDTLPKILRMDQIVDGVLKEAGNRSVEQIAKEENKQLLKDRDLLDTKTEKGRLEIEKLNAKYDV